MKKIILTLLVIISIFTLCSCGNRKIENREIKSCVLTQDKTKQTNGSFVILFASVSSKEKIKTKYYLYIKGKEGFKLQDIESDYLEIVETDDMKPQIKGEFYGGNGEILDYTDYVVYVPKGTITQEYKANTSELEE